MNHWQYSQLKMGQIETFEVCITDDMLQQFRNLTQDNNPLHCDDEYAKKKGYSGRVCYGMLTASFLSTLAGVYLPGENSLIHGVETKFVKPVFPGDKLTIIGTINKMNDLFQVITIKVQIINQKQEKVLRGTMDVGVVNE